MKVLMLAIAACLMPLSAAAAPLLLPRRHTELLPASQAFRMLPALRRKNRVLIEWDIAPGYYLYRRRLTFSVVDPRDLKLRPLLPKGLTHADKYLGKVEIYRNSLRAQLPIPAGTGNMRLKIGYQGCADAGLCYPPQHQIVTVPAE